MSRYQGEWWGDTWLPPARLGIRQGLGLVADHGRYRKLSIAVPMPQLRSVLQTRKGRSSAGIDG